MYLILGMILFGMVIGAGAQFILGREHGKVDWTMAIVAGLVGSFIGGSSSACSAVTASRCARAGSSGPSRAP